MRIQSILKVLGGVALSLPNVYAKSQDYARHLELSLLFYEGKKIIYIKKIIYYQIII